MATAAAPTAAAPAAALVLLLCTCYCCAVLLLLLLLLCLRYVFAADPREHGYYASHPPLGDVSPHLEAERLLHLVRELYEYSLVIDILFGISAEVSRQRSFRTVRTCTLCCYFCLLLLSFLHQRNRRRFVLPICSIDCSCSTNCFWAICVRSTQYGRRASRT